MKHLLALSLALLASACVLVVRPPDSQGSAWVSLDGSSKLFDGSGIVASQAREVPKFHAVRVGGAFDVRVAMGRTRSVVLEGDDNLLEHVCTRVEDGVLVLDFAPGRYRTRRPLSVVLVTETLTALEVHGAGDVRLEGVVGERLGIVISGSGDVMANGAVDVLELSITGAGKAYFMGLDAERASVTISGAGSAVVAVSKRLDVAISGAGDVRYCGRPQVSKSVSGAGSVQPLGG
ncbi:MAG: DUF2807 domain-containing protein [Planctomycetes bacterium]|nr:DUF2807 domain-containing protein [Planctomycetota bacterium]